MLLKFDCNENMNDNTGYKPMKKKNVDLQPAPLLNLAFVLVSCIQALLDVQFSVALFMLNKLEQVMMMRIM